MLNFLYTVIIYPLIQLIEFAFMLFNNVFKNEGISVIGVSLAVSIGTLPLYIVVYALVPVVNPFPALLLVVNEFK